MMQVIAEVLIYSYNSGKSFIQEPDKTQSFLPCSTGDSQSPSLLSETTLWCFLLYQAPSGWRAWAAHSPLTWPTWPSLSRSSSVGVASVSDENVDASLLGPVHLLLLPLLIRKINKRKYLTDVRIAFRITNFIVIALIFPFIYLFIFFFWGRSVSD